MHVSICLLDLLNKMYFHTFELSVSFRNQVHAVCGGSAENLGHLGCHQIHVPFISFRWQFTEWTDLSITPLNDNGIPVAHKTLPCACNGIIHPSILRTHFVLFRVKWGDWSLSQLSQMYILEWQLVYQSTVLKIAEGITAVLHAEYKCECNSLICVEPVMGPSYKPNCLK